jgi:hypothetical protein
MTEEDMAAVIADKDAEITRLKDDVDAWRLTMRFAVAAWIATSIIIIALFMIGKSHAAVSWSCSDGSRYWYAEFQTPKCQEGKLSEVNFNAPPVGYTETFDRNGHVVPEGQNSGR